MDIDTQVRHETARQNADVLQRAAGFRHAAMILDTHLPTGTVAADAVRAVAARLRADAAQMEVGIR